MEISGTPEWVQAARAAAGILRSRGESLRPETPAVSPVEPSPVKTADKSWADFLAVKPAAFSLGLGGLEQTQDFETIETKGLIVDRYL